MSNQYSGQDLFEFKPRFAWLSGITIFAWIIFGIFRSIDDQRLFFVSTMMISAILAAYQLRDSRKQRNPIQGSSVAIFVWIWLAVFSFTRDASRATILDYSIRLKQLEFLALLPLTLIWIKPYKDETFFGILETDDADRLHSIWRIGVLILIVINIFKEIPTWYWSILEFSILIPMIYETARLQQLHKDELPVLTLFIQTEMAEKFAVPLSMIKSVFFIMVAFIFGIVESRFWLLVILGYFAAGMIWGVISLIPEEQRSRKTTRNDFDENSLDDLLGKKFGSSRNRRKERRIRKKERKSSEQKMETVELSNYSENESEETTEILVEKIDETEPIVDGELVEIDTSTSLNTTNSSRSGLVKPAEGSIQQKAHKMGQKVRSSIEKPYYTLNHILSTLKAEDFSQAWRVGKSGMVFLSQSGKWSPPVGLILFPIELEKYDFRRKKQILLLGFNKPLQNKSSKFNIDFGNKSKHNTKITDNSIKFGDVEFNTRSLIVTKEQWEEIQKQLDIVTQDDDISYTGFKTLHHMQDILASVSDKWIEVRLTAQEVAVNFLAGLLGSSDPVFIPREGLDQPKYHQIPDNSHKDETKEEVV